MGGEGVNRVGEGRGAATGERGGGGGEEGGAGKQNSNFIMESKFRILFQNDMIRIAQLMRANGNKSYRSDHSYFNWFF